MRIIATEKQIYAGIMGLAVGDALGVPYEFKVRDSFEATGMRGWGTYNQPPGTWSDDTSMTLATLDSIVACRDVNLTDIMGRFAKWLIRGCYTPYGTTFDCGFTTQRAIRRFADGADVHECGGNQEQDNGNGALMRMMPLAFWYAGIQWAGDVGGLTHAHEISKKICRAYVTIAKNIVVGLPKIDAVARGLADCEYGKGITDIMAWTRDEIKSGGFVVDTFEAALWCFANTQNYKDCVLTAVNLGYDTDTTAAVAGGLAGLWYGVGGEKGIPEDWIKQIARKDEIEAICRDLSRLGWKQPKLDTPLLVSADQKKWEKGHYAGYNESTAEVGIWADGKTSFTSDGKITWWDFAKPAGVDAE